MTLEPQKEEEILELDTDKDFKDWADDKLDHAADILLGRAGVALERVQRNSASAYILQKFAATGDVEQVKKDLAALEKKDMSVSIGNTTHISLAPATSQAGVLPGRQPSPKPSPKPTVAAPNGGNAPKAPTTPPNDILPDLGPLPGAKLVKPVGAALVALAVVVGTSGLTAHFMGGTPPQVVDFTEVNQRIDQLATKLTVLDNRKMPIPILEIEPVKVGTSE